MNWIINFENGKSPCRVNQAATPVGPFIYSFGGYCQQTTVSELKCYSPIDVHVLNTITFEWHKRPKPQIKDPQYQVTPYFRYGHTCVTYNDLIYLWGGRADWTNSLCNTLYAYKPNEHTWSRVDTDGNRPDGRDGHSACVISELNLMLIFGGYVQKIKKFSNDIFEYDFKTSAWTLIIPKNNIKPHWRDFHSASCVGTEMYIFGGRMDCGHETFTGESFYSNDLYMFDITKKQWVEVRPDTSRSLGSSEANESVASKSKIFSPCGRRSHSAVVYKRKIIIFGGFQENIHKHFNDIYEYDVDKGEWKSLAPSGKFPSPRRRHSCCVINDKMYLFGGTGPSSEANNGLSNNHQLAIITNNTNQNDILRNIRIIEPALHQLELNLNQINNALRDRNSLNFNVLNHALAVALAALARPRNDQHQHALAVDNNQINRPQIRYHPERAQDNLMIQEPQDEFAGEVNEYQEPERMEINELNQNDDNPNNNNIININNNNINNNNDNNNYIVEEQDDDTVYNEEDDLMDSGDEDLIDEGTEDEEDFNQGLISLSDLHILDLEVPTLRSLSIIEIMNNKLDYKSLPKILV